MKIGLVLLLMNLTFINIISQNFDREKIDSLLQIIDVKQKAMGSVSIFENGKEVYQKVFGYADIENKVKATRNTKYRIGSITKTFTATIIMQLIEEGKLNLETKLAEFYPEISNSEEITIEHLLRHRSGLYNFTDDKDFSSWMEKPHTKKEILKIIIKNGTIFNPNVKAEYSNTNYVLLAYIAENIEGKDYAKILKQRIIEPCKLKNTYYGGEINTEENEALSYTKLSTWKLATETDMSITEGAGGIVSTPTDLNIFINQLFQGNLVSKNSLGKMTDIVDKYGIGLFRFCFGDKEVFGHTGGIDEFLSKLMYFPNENISIAFSSNGLALSMKNIVDGILSIYFGREYVLPNFESYLNLTSADLNKYLGVYGSSTNPLKITVSKEHNVLIAQASGQPPVPLEAFELHKFKFEQAGIEFEFVPDENKMILKQGGGEYVLIKEK